MLILDSHGSHVDVDFLYTCWTSKVAIVFLLPHSSHVLQPLDLSLFAVLKIKYREQIKIGAVLSDSALIKKRKFIQYYEVARSRSFILSTIEAGWRATGIYPFNPSLPLGLSFVFVRPITPPEPPPIDNLPSWLQTP